MFDEGPAIPMGTPKRADDNLLFVEGVVDMAGDLAKVDAAEASNIRSSVGRASSGKDCQDSEGLFELGCENLRVGPVLKPSDLLAPDVAPRRRRESDAALLQRDLSSLRISTKVNQVLSINLSTGLRLGDETAIKSNVRVQNGDGSKASILVRINGQLVA